MSGGVLVTWKKDRSEKKMKGSIFEGHYISSIGEWPIRVGRKKVNNLSHGCISLWGRKIKKEKICSHLESNQGYQSHNLVYYHCTMWAIQTMREFVIFKLNKKEWEPHNVRIEWEKPCNKCISERASAEVRSNLFPHRDGVSFQSATAPNWMKRENQK